MSYNFPNERRRIERRVAPSAAYAGPERRKVERRATEVKLVRKPEPMHRGVLWAAVAMILVLADSVFLEGAYRHMIVGWFSDMAASARDWSAHVWDWGH
ncbi:MAG: hypothetical protein ACK4ZY_08155 [Sphingomonas sp.]